MHEHLESFTQNPSQKFHKNFINFEKPQKVFKITQNVVLNAWRMSDKEIIPSDLRQEKAENHMGWRFWERRECLGGEKTENNQERLRRNEEKSRKTFI